jgi:hypothetical protein
MISWSEERARMLASLPTSHAPNPGPDPLGEPVGPDDDETDCACTESRPCAEHFDDVFEAYRNGQEDRYLEHGHGQLGGAA